MKQLRNLLLIVALMSFAPKHKFYFSLTSIKVDTQQKNLNVSCKLFIDDLEQILLNTNKVKYDLTKSEQIKAAEQAIYQYMVNHLKLNINNKNMPLNWVGFETENDVVWIYLESKCTDKKFNNLKVSNSILCNLTTEQTNLVQFNWDLKSYTEKMNCGTKEVIIKD